MKKYLIVGILVVAFIIYVVFENKNSAPLATTPNTTPTSSDPSTSPPSTPTTTTLTFGDTGTDVSSLQQFLIAQKYLVAVSAPTGYFGPLTQTALIKFQSANNISPATGVLDGQTSALISALSSATTTATGKYKDGTYTGSVADAFYGNLQAVAVIKSGLIVDVMFPQSPSGGHSGEVSAFALPVLKQEAIATQSANVNIVSGATQDSQAFQQSLSVALAQAKK